MAQKMSNKKKASIAAVGVLAVALVLGGAYAWTDYSQTARNTFKDNVDADVLLHDDFDGKNKDVYVENTGNTDVYVRVKFAEYFQIGNDSILDAYNTTTGLKADPKDVTTWPIHQFKDATASNVCDLEDTHKYFTWNMSGAQKQYLAGVTEADGNGYAGLSQTAFDNYQVGDLVPLGDGITTYKRKTAETSAIIMLSKWLELVQGTYDTMSDDDKKLWDAAEAGCWLLDSDGWAYWSAPLEPDSATNLLLDEVTVNKKKPHDNWVYHIDVQMQAATQNEMDRWYLDGNADVANPDNSIATTTKNGELFIKYKMDAVTEYEYEEIGSTNVWQEYAVSIVGSKTATGVIVLGGNDLDPYTTADNNMLAGRSKADNGGIAVDVASIDATNMQYNIKGVSTDYYVTAGIDKTLGTYDDVIQSTSGALGKYDITGDGVTENIGWNYLYGPLENMLVATEYVLDNVQYCNSTFFSGDHYPYADSQVKKRMDTLWTTWGANMTVKVNPVNGDNDTINNLLDMDTNQHQGKWVYICPTTHSHSLTSDDCAENCIFTTYYTNTAAQTDIDLGNTKFFSLSLNEMITAYGESSRDGANTDPVVLRNCAAKGAPKWADTDTTYTPSKNGIYTDYGVATAHYWLRSPGYIGSRVAYVYANGRLDATGYAHGDNAGVRPACYLNLSTATTTP